MSFTRLHEELEQKARRTNANNDIISFWEYFSSWSADSYCAWRPSYFNQTVFSSLSCASFPNSLRATGRKLTWKCRAGPGSVFPPAGQDARVGWAVTSTDLRVFFLSICVGLQEHGEKDALKRDTRLFSFLFFFYIHRRELLFVPHFFI